MAVTNFLAARRHELGMSQFRMAIALNITPAAVSAWECGVCLPTPDKFDALARVLKVDFETICVEVGKLARPSKARPVAV